jgi:hypothetical protein
MGSSTGGREAWQITVIWYKPNRQTNTAVIPGEGEPFEAVELGYMPRVDDLKEPPQPGQLIEVRGYISSSVAIGSMGLYKKARFHVEHLAKIGLPLPLLVNIQEHIRAVGSNKNPQPSR